MATKARSIVADIQAALEAIDGGPNYATTVKAVYGHDKPYLPPQESEDEHRPYLNLGQPSEEPSAFANSKTLKTLRIPVEGVVTYDHEDPEASRAAAIDLLGDVEKALQVDPSRGGYAIDTVSESGAVPSMITTHDPERPMFLSLSQVIAVSYGHSRTDPSTD